MRYTASVIGIGNVGSQIVLSLHKMGVTIDYVVGRDLDLVQSIASKVGANALSEIENFAFYSDFLILSVNDDSYSEVISKISVKDSTVVLHTSGSLPMNIFENKFKNYGVFYPLQTFSITRAACFDFVPICIEASSSIVYDQLSRFAGCLSEDVRKINSDERLKIHLAAVFCNNFSNYMYLCAKELMKDCNTSFDILFPLIKEGVHKMIDIGPENAQTGPAIRGDHSIIDNHIAMLQDSKYKEIYIMITNQIFNNFNS